MNRRELPRAAPTLPAEMAGPRLLRPRDVVRMSGMSSSTVWYWMDTGDLPVEMYTVGGHARYKRSEVVAFLTGRGLLKSVT